MEHKNCQVNISINDKTYSIYYSYRHDSTFQDLLEYFAFLYPKLNICQCYCFKTGSCCEDLLKISKNSNITDYSDYLSNLKLYINNNEGKCAHTEINKLLYSKFYIDSKYQKIITDLKKQILSKNKIIADNTKKIEEIEKKNMLLIQSIDGNTEIIKLREKMGVIPKKSENSKNEIVQNKTTNILQLNQNIILNDEKQKFAGFYDVIVHIDSIKDINKGWKIEMNKRGEKIYNEFKNKPMLKIGIIGNANKGKSFILSKISKIALPSRMSIKSEGLSIKYSDLRIFSKITIALLESAGLETPVLVSDLKSDKDKNELFREKSREKLITELFLQNYIVNNSDILIVVVDSLSFSEQKLLMKVKKEMEKSKKFIPLYIIHNLKAYTSRRQVEDYIRETLLKSATFTLKQHICHCPTWNKISGIHFYELLNKEEKDIFPNIFHLIYANEYSEAGKIYNQYTLDFIDHIYKNITNLKSFDVIESIKERYINISKDIIEKSENEQPLTNKSFDDSNPKIIKLKDEKEIILKKCLINELGFSNFKANGFEPKYNLFNNDNKIIVRVEIPGNCEVKSKIEIQGEYNMIKIFGEKIKDKEPDNLEQNIYNSREIGRFVLEIPLKYAVYRLCYKEPRMKMRQGVCILEYDLDVYINKGQLEPNDNTKET